MHELKQLHNVSCKNSFKIFLIPVVDWLAGYNYKDTLHTSLCFFHKVSLKIFIINEIEIRYYKNNRWCLFMNNRLEIAQEFAKSINSDKIVKIILFGSVARGDDTEDSDIDILIISDYRSEIWEDIADLIGEIVLEKQELISAHIMTTERFNTTQDYSFLSNVLAEGEVLV